MLSSITQKQVLGQGYLIFHYAFPPIVAKWTCPKWKIQISLYSPDSIISLEPIAWHQLYNCSDVTDLCDAECCHSTEQAQYRLYYIVNAIYQKTALLSWYDDIDLKTCFCVMQLMLDIVGSIRAAWVCMTGPQVKTFHFPNMDFL